MIYLDFDSSFKRPLCNHWLINIVENASRESFEDTKPDIRESHRMGKVWGIFYKPKKLARTLLKNLVTMSSPLEKLQEETIFILKHCQSIIETRPFEKKICGISWDECEDDTYDVSHRMMTPEEVLKEEFELVIPPEV